MAQTEPAGVQLPEESKQASSSKPFVKQAVLDRNQSSPQERDKLIR